MFLRNLSLVNFKNYAGVELAFGPGVNVFAGNNGAGKTNLLDAIHYLSLCKSYFNPIDSQNIRHGEDFFVIQGAYDLNGLEATVYCGLKKNTRKVFKYNNKEYERLASHIGLLPVVLISPVDSMLITEGSEERRKFMDSIISQYDKIYLDTLIQYNKILSQRNALLKHFAQSRSFDASQLNIWSEQLINKGQQIFEKRREFMANFTPVFLEHYRQLTDAGEDASVVYESHHAQGNYSGILSSSLERDRVVQFTTIGIHKDDLILLLGGYPVKRIASQGQQKSFLLSLKLAQFDFICREKGMKPILLLDDIFDKLDARRVKRLMELVSRDSFRQIFITDTHPERVLHIFSELRIPLKMFSVENGMISPA